MSKAQALPATQVHWTYVKVKDKHPVTGNDLEFEFPHTMDAYPLTNVAPQDTTIRGSGPDNKALWWPYFQQRHKLGGLFWVQGHMLNDNVWGPGDPRNLVPISNTLNTTMEALVEREVKSRIGKGQALRFTVRAHWGSNFNSPGQIRQAFGFIENSSGPLFFGEHMAPTHLSWEIYELNYNSMGSLASTPMLLSSQNYIANKSLSQWAPETHQWNNHFPQ